MSQDVGTYLCDFPKAKKQCYISDRAVATLTDPRSHAPEFGHLGGLSNAQHGVLESRRRNFSMMSIALPFYFVTNIYIILIT